MSKKICLLCDGVYSDEAIGPEIPLCRKCKSSTAIVAVKLKATIDKKDKEITKITGWVVEMLSAIGCRCEDLGGIKTRCRRCQILEEMEAK